MGMFDAPGPPINTPDEDPADKSEDGFTTDVEGVKSNDVIKVGVDEFPVFDCTETEFNQNMAHGRKRLRFKSGTAVQQYMSGTKYKRQFFIRTTDAKGQQYTRKIK